MCGIIGFNWQPDIKWPGKGSGPGATLSTGVETLRHRGPDDSGTFLEASQGIALGHTRLAILDLSSAGRQPMHAEDGAVTIVFNGEIYNFRKLRSDLVQRGWKFRGTSDTEVLLKLYLDQGQAMLAQLNGIFALAIWDSRRNGLFVARDAFGVKPLYFHTAPGFFAFGSEIKSILPVVGDRQLDVSALNRYLTFLWCPGDQTPLQTVKKLAPGTAMWVKDGKIDQAFSWYQLPAFDPAPTPVPDVGEAIDGTISHLRDAVHRQMVADVPLGAFLSGGLDSSAIAVFAREHTPNLRCFTIEVRGGYGGGTTDDLPYAKRVANHLELPLEVVTIDASRMANDLEEMIWQLDEPLADPAPLNVLYISQLAKNFDMKVLLSGAGGDDIFSGYRRHFAMQFDPVIQFLPRQLRRSLELMTQKLNQRRPLLRRVTKFFDGASLEGDKRIANYFRWVRRSDLAALYSQEFKAELGAQRAEEPLYQFLDAIPSNVPALERMLALEQRFFLTDHNLNYTDKMAMVAGVEARVPFLDPDLVKFASRIPTRYKQRGKEGKWILKKAMESYLPKDVIYRPKTGFGAPLRHWLTSELKELVLDVLSIDSLRSRGLFNPEAVHRLIRQNEQGEIDASYTIFSLLAIEIWCRRFLDQTKPS